MSEYKKRVYRKVHKMRFDGGNEKCEKKSETTVEFTANEWSKW